MVRLVVGLGVVADLVTVATFMVWMFWLCVQVFCCMRWLCLGSSFGLVKVVFVFVSY